MGSGDCRGGEREDKGEGVASTNKEDAALPRQSTEMAFVHKKLGVLEVLVEIRPFAQSRPRCWS